MIIGLFVGIAAFFGAMLNFSFGLAGVAGVNPVFLVVEVLLILAWRNAGYLGLDRYVLPAIGTPWHKGTVFRHGRRVPTSNSPDPPQASHRRRGRTAPPSSRWCNVPWTPGPSARGIPGHRHQAHRRQTMCFRGPFRHGWCSASAETPRLERVERSSGGTGNPWVGPARAIKPPPHCSRTACSGVTSVSAHGRRPRERRAAGPSRGCSPSRRSRGARRRGRRRAGSSEGARSHRPSARRGSRPGAGTSPTTEPSRRHRCR